MDAQKAKRTLKKQYARQNSYIRDNFDRVSVTLPKGTKERIVATGESINGFINKVVFEALELIEEKKQDQQPEENQV